MDSKERCSLSGAGPRELDPARGMNEMLPNERLLVDSPLDARMLKQKCVSKTVRHVQWMFGGRNVGTPRHKRLASFCFSSFLMIVQNCHMEPCMGPVFMVD